jgi:hypothetical protein
MMFSRFTLKSSELPEVLSERLRSSLNVLLPCFHGVNSGSEFKVTRFEWLGSWCFPVIANGNFEHDLDGGTMIHVRTRPTGSSMGKVPR